MGGAGVQTVDRVAPVHDAGADEEGVVGRLRGEGAEGGGDHRGRMAAQHAAVVDVARVADVAACRLRRDPQPVVVLLDGHDTGPAVATYGASPRLPQPVGHRGDEKLDRMGSLVGVGEVPDGEVAGEVFGTESGRHGVSFADEGGGRG